MSDAVTLAIAVLAESFNAKVENLPAMRLKLLQKALAGVPAPILEPMVLRAIRTRKPRWGDLPAPAELLEDAEYARIELLRAMGPFIRCPVNYGCSEQGWCEVTHPDGVRAERCACWTRWQQQIAQLGAGHQPLSLPPARTDGIQADA
mgnify:CR=1 FL=1